MVLYDSDVKRIREEIQRLDLEGLVRVYLGARYNSMAVDAVLSGMRIEIHEEDPGPGPGPGPDPLPLERKEPIQDWVKRIFRYLFARSLLTDLEIARLHDKKYSKETFDISFPMLVDSYKDIRVAGHARYWVDKIGGYYICSQWWKDYDAVYEFRIRRWLSRVLPDFKERVLDRRVFPVRRWE